MYRVIKHILNLAIGVLISPIFTFADGTLSISWNANTENDLAGYRVHYGRSTGTYENVINVGTTTTQTINDLSGGATYYFVVTALDQAGNESRPSSELSFSLPPDIAPLPAAPVITAVRATNMTTSTASIAWNTDQAADSRVEYGVNATYGSTSALDASHVTSHVVSLSNLIPGTLYHYRVKSRDAAGREVASADSTFLTLAPPPVASNPTVNLALRKPTAASSTSGERTPDKATDGNSDTYWRNGAQGSNQLAWLQVDLEAAQKIGCAVIEWHSSYFAKKYEIQVSNDGANWKVAHAQKVGNGITQSIKFASVSARYARLYMTEMNNGNYRVKSFEVYADAAAPVGGNPSDKKGPVISAIDASKKTASSIIITWTTDIAANALIEYGVDSTYGKLSTLDTQFLTAHSLSITDLTPNTVYHYRIISKSAAGQLSTSSDLTFRTLELAPISKNPPVDLALHKPAVASNFSGERTADQAMDGDSNTYWRNGAQGSNQTAWLRVDLEAAQKIAYAVIEWHSSYFAKQYEIQVSNDGANWKVVHANKADNGITQIIKLASVSARYARLYMTEMNNGNYRVKALELYADAPVLASNRFNDAEDVKAELEASTSGNDATSIAPRSFTLHQNFPNPFNPTTEIKYDLEKNARAILNIYNALGQRVRTLYDGHQNAGQHSVRWDARNNDGQMVPSGAYLYTLEIKEEIGSGAMTMTATMARQSRTMTLLK